MHTASCIFDRKGDCGPQRVPILFGKHWCCFQRDKDVALLSVFQGISQYICEDDMPRTGAGGKCPGRSAVDVKDQLRSAPTSLRFRPI